MEGGDRLRNDSNFSDSTKAHGIFHLLTDEKLAQRFGMRWWEGASLSIRAGSFVVNGVGWVDLIFRVKLKINIVVEPSGVKKKSGWS